MITLFLISAGILKQPVLYLSDYLERNRGKLFLFQPYLDLFAEHREKGLG